MNKFVLCSLVILTSGLSSLHAGRKDKQLDVTKYPNACDYDQQRRATQPRDKKENRENNRNNGHVPRKKSGNNFRS